MILPNISGEVRMSMECAPTFNFARDTKNQKIHILPSEDEGNDQTNVQVENFIPCSVEIISEEPNYQLLH